jgi:hypothetical protein
MKGQPFLLDTINIEGKQHRLFLFPGFLCTLFRFGFGFLTRATAASPAHFWFSLFFACKMAQQSF